jgi:hypothetical protein
VKPTCYYCHGQFDLDGCWFDASPPLPEPAKWICMTCIDRRGADGAHALYVADSVKRGVRRPMQWNTLGRKTQSRWMRALDRRELAVRSQTFTPSARNVVRVNLHRLDVRGMLVKYPQAYAIAKR